MNIYKNIFFIIGILAFAQTSNACTGITLKSNDNSIVVGRTMDWSAQETPSMYVIVPRGHQDISKLPNQEYGGMTYTAKYGYVGLSVEEPQYVLDGINEAGLHAALFYFPEYGKYTEYDPNQKEVSLADFQVVSWMLSQFSSIEEIKSAIKYINIINVDSRAKTVHWRITDSTGRIVVLEITDGIPKFYENKIGVITNSPGFEWQMENLNNYVNLIPGTAGPTKMGDITLTAFGKGSGFLGLPGDFTPPSRFVRAAFLQTYSIPQSDGYDSSMQAFHILNNFDVPLGIQFAQNKAPNNMPSATQWTVVTDMTNKMIYYHTMYNRTIRSINLNAIDFETISYQYHGLDDIKQQTIIPVNLD